MGGEGKRIESWMLILRIHVDFTVNIVSRCQNLPILPAADPMQHCVSNLEALVLIWKTH